MKPRVLVACEFSGAVRNAFTAQGCYAVSCDLLPTETPGPHYMGDIADILHEDWDLIVAFPPCTHLAVSGARWFPQKRKDGRQQAALDFVQMFFDRDPPRLCIENPVGVISTEIRRPTQIVQPWMFGDAYTKTTCLWLVRLPKLAPTKIVEKGQRHITKSGKSLPAWYNLPPGPERAKIRSKTFPGIAAAMAAQWAPLLK